MGKIIEEVKGLYRIISIDEFRKTPDVEFLVQKGENLPRIDSIDKVVHKSNAVSPSVNKNGDRTWYMHPCQDDNLIVL